MLDTISYQKKNKLLLIVIGLAVVLIYFLSIKKTITTYLSYSENFKQLELASNAPLMAGQMDKELLEINSKLGSQNVDGPNYSEKLLELVTRYCQDNNIVLREFPEINTAEKDDLLIETNRFTISGNYSALLKLVYILEQKNKLGKIAAVNYKTQKDFKTKETVLTATVYLQNIKKK